MSTPDPRSLRGAPTEDSEQLEGSPPPTRAANEDLPQDHLPDTTDDAGTPVDNPSG